MKTFPSLLTPLRHLLRPEHHRGSTSPAGAREPYAPRNGPDRCGGQHRLWQALEAARVLEDPDSSEEAQQTARETMRDALRAMLTAR